MQGAAAAGRLAAAAAGGILEAQGVGADLAWATDICRLATGNYTGDGTLSQGITGVGFQPKAVRIFPEYTVENLSTDGPWFYSDQHGGLAELHQRASDWIRDNRIISLDADGFTVDDDGGDNRPNKNGEKYWFVCWG